LQVILERDQGHLVKLPLVTKCYLLKLMTCCKPLVFFSERPISRIRMHAGKSGITGPHSRHYHVMLYYFWGRLQPFMASSVAPPVCRPGGLGSGLPFHGIYDEAQQLIPLD